MDFVLVHGAYHRASCWSRVEAELSARGHRTASVDLPISDPRAGLTEYRDSVLASAERFEVPVVVGHSMSGSVIPLVAAARPVSRMVFLAAFVPVPGRSLNEQRAAEQIETYQLGTHEFEDRGEGVWMVGEDTARELFYPDADDEQSQEAYRGLRPQAYNVFRERSPMTDWPDVDSGYILCREDRALDPEWSRATARNRLGTTALEMEGGHSPFLTRPGELVDLLETAASG